MSEQSAKRAATASAVTIACPGVDVLVTRFEGTLSISDPSAYTGFHKLPTPTPRTKSENEAERKIANFLRILLERTLPESPIKLLDVKPNPIAVGVFRPSKHPNSNLRLREQEEDFLILTNRGLIALEVKAGYDRRAKRQLDNYTSALRCMLQHHAMKCMIVGSAVFVDSDRTVESVEYAFGHKTSCHTLDAFGKWLNSSALLALKDMEPLDDSVLKFCRANFFSDSYVSPVVGRDKFLRLTVQQFELLKQNKDDRKEEPGAEKKVLISGGPGSGKTETMLIKLMQIALEFPAQSILLMCYNSGLKQDLK